MLGLKFKWISAFLLCLVHSAYVYTQVDSLDTVYGKLELKEVYSKSPSFFDDIQSCTPCIIKYYQKPYVLKYEAIQYGDCFTGFYKEYYPDGSIKVKGQFKENRSNNWDNIFHRGYCNVPDGKWLYFNDKGQIKSIEIWNKGNFVEQKPESKKVEIWKVELSLNEVTIDTQKIALGEFNQLQFRPKYKNSNRGSELNLKLRVSATDYKSVEERFLIDQFDQIKIESLLKKVGISELEKINVQIGVYEKDKNIWNFYLKLKD